MAFNTTNYTHVCKHEHACTLTLICMQAHHKDRQGKVTIFMVGSN